MNTHARTRRDYVKKHDFTCKEHLNADKISQIVCFWYNNNTKQMMSIDIINIILEYSKCIEFEKIRPRCCRELFHMGSANGTIHDSQILSSVATFCGQTGKRSKTRNKSNNSAEEPLERISRKITNDMLINISFMPSSSKNRTPFQHNRYRHRFYDEEFKLNSSISLIKHNECQ